MKKTVASLFTAGLLACSAGLALADGIPTAANIAEAPIGGNEWRGFYVSAAIGYSKGESEVYVDPNSEGLDPDGVTGTLGLGYDIMLRENLLVGVLADYTFGELDDKFDLGTGIFSKWDLDDTWAVGGRIGTFIHKDLLLYGTAGYTRTELTVSNAGGSASEDLDGFFVGAGLERLICNNLYLKGEYRYSHFEDIDGVTDPALNGCGPGVGCDFEQENETHSIRLGVAYKFGARQEEAVPLK